MLKKLTLSLSFLMILISLISASFAATKSAESALDSTDDMPMTANSISWWWQ